MQVLYVEDSLTLRQTVAHGLKRAGYLVTTVADGIEGLDMAMTHNFDVIILDVMLPGMNGFDILREIRKAGIASEVLMLTSRTSIEERVAGLDLGADDYLVKPFSFDELSARVRVLIRRRFDAKSPAINLGELTIDLNIRKIFLRDSEIVLRPREFDILECLAFRAGKIVSRSELIEHVYDHARDLKSNTVDSAICNIRKAFSEAGMEKLISTIPRRGYLLEVES